MELSQESAVGLLGQLIAQAYATRTYAAPELEQAGPRATARIRGVPEATVEFEAGPAGLSWHTCALSETAREGFVGYEEGEAVFPHLLAHQLGYALPDRTWARADAVARP